MAILLPLVFILAATLLVDSHRTRSGFQTRRESLLAGLILFGLTTAAGTGLLSLFNAVSPAGLTLFWITADLLLLMLLYASDETPPEKRLCEPFCWTEKIMLCAWILILGTTAFLAIFVPPNSWDAMSYHLGRVAHWQFNHNVTFYPTNIPRQLWSMPLAEYIILHLQILGGSDRWANLVQWGAFAGSGIAASLIAGIFGLPRPGQIAALLITSTIPMAVLQGASTQNDLVTAFWIITTIVFLMRWVTQGQNTALALWAAGALALGTFTKGTPFLVMPGFIVAAINLAPHNRKRVTLFKILVLSVLACCGPFFLRTIIDYDTVVPSHEETDVNNRAMDPTLFISSLTRHSAVQLMTPFQKVNNLTIDAVRGIHRRISVDWNDPRITVGGDDGFLLAVSAYDEYYAGNALHFLLGLLSCGYGLIFFRRMHRTFAPYILALISGFLLFILYMRWQPWIARLELPFFIVGAPVIAGVLFALDKKMRILIAAALLLTLTALPWIFKAKLKPIVGKKTVFTLTETERYFLNRPYLREPFIWATDSIRASGCTRVGLITDVGGWEYPYWVLLKDIEGMDIRHVRVTDVSTRYDDRTWQPCAIIQDSNQDPPERLNHRGTLYNRQGYHKPLALYRPEDI